MAQITRALAEIQFRPDRWPASQFPNARERLVEGHTIVYRIDSSAMEVTVIRIFGPHQDRATL